MAHPKHSNPLMPSESDDDNGFDSNPLQGHHNNQHHHDCSPLFEAADDEDSHCFGALVSGEEETSNEEGSGDSTTTNNIFNLGAPSLGTEMPQQHHTHKTTTNCIVGLENVSSSGGPHFDLRIDCQSDDCYHSSTGGGSIVSLGFTTSNGSGGGGVPLTPSTTTITTRNGTFLAPATSPAHAEASPMMLRRVLSNGRMKPSDKSNNSSTLRGPLSADSTPTHADQPKSANPSELPPLANNVIDSSQDRPFYIPQLDGICHTFLGRPAVDCTTSQRMRTGDDDDDDTDGAPLGCWLSPSGARKRSGGGGDFALDEDALGCHEDDDDDDDASREEKVPCSNPLTLTPPRSPRLGGLGFRIGSEDHSPQAPSNRFVLAQSDTTAGTCSSSSLLGGNIVAAKILNRISADDEADDNGQPSLPCFRPPAAGFAGCSLPGGDDDNESTSRGRAVPHRLLLLRQGEQSDLERQLSAEELQN